MPADPLVAELIAASDVDVVCIEAQHGYADSLPALLQSMRAVGRVPLARVRWNDPGRIIRALDARACGVVVPMIHTPEDAMTAAQACRNPPDGNRSWGPLWSARPTQEPAESNDQVLCAVMVETAKAVDNLPAILSTPGVDASYIGPNGLAISCGHGRDTYRTNRTVDELLTSVMAAAHTAGVPFGTHCSDSEMASEWRERGADWVTALTDVDVLASGLRSITSTMRQGPVA